MLQFKIFSCVMLISIVILPVLSVEDADYWMKLGTSSIESALNVKKNEGMAKSGIIFIGDGMGMSTITAGRIFKGQLENRPGEEGYLSFEKFPTVGLLKTYNVDRQVPDSAGTATALFSGVKGNYYTLGLDGTAQFNVCRSDIEAKAKVSSIIDWAIAAKKSTGIVTTTRITHATPAATYGHSAHRDWECDLKIPPSERNLGCKDIARQLVEDEPGRNINVILGGGEQILRSKVNESTACVRGDGADLVWDWMQYQRGQKRKYRYVRTKAQLMDEGLDSSVDYLLGLFAPNHIPYDKDRNTEPHGQPSLQEMTKQAIKILSKNPNGFVLIVEGGRIDHAHHDNLAKIALEELVAFDKAIETGIEMTKEKEETMIIVTADHSHAMSMSGYPKRGNPIEGLADKTPEGYAYQTLSYINGPGYTVHRMSSNVSGTNSTLQTRNTWKDLASMGANATEDRQQVHHAGFWMDYETHGGEDVPVYAMGPMGHLLHGVHEQTQVPIAMAYSLCIGPYEKKCRNSAEGGGAVVGGGGDDSHHSKENGHGHNNAGGKKTSGSNRLNNNSNIWLLTAVLLYIGRSTSILTSLPNYYHL